LIATWYSLRRSTEQEIITMMCDITHTHTHTHTPEKHASKRSLNYTTYLPVLFMSYQYKKSIPIDNETQTTNQLQPLFEIKLTKLKQSKDQTISS
jgi:hypothetical protein